MPRAVDGDETAVSRLGARTRCASGPRSTSATPSPSPTPSPMSTPSIGDPRQRFDIRSRQPEVMASWWALRPTSSPGSMTRVEAAADPECDSEIFAPRHRRLRQYWILLLVALLQELSIGSSRKWKTFRQAVALTHVLAAPCIWPPISFSSRAGIRPSALLDVDAKAAESLPHKVRALGRAHCRLRRRILSSSVFGPRSPPFPQPGHGSPSQSSSQQPLHRALRRLAADHLSSLQGLARHFAVNVDVVQTSSTRGVPGSGWFSSLRFVNLASFLGPASSPSRTRFHMLPTSSHISLSSSVITSFAFTEFHLQ